MSLDNNNNNNILIIKIVIIMVYINSLGRDETTSAASD